MKINRRQMVLGGLSITGAISISGCARPDPGVRIGFVVKQPEEQWFQDEWRFADEAAAEKGFQIIRIGAPDGDRVLTAINTLYSKFAQGFIICTPEPILGEAIKLRADATDLKVMSVDDRLIGSDGQPIESIPHVGISARQIGELAGSSAIEEASRRGWDLGKTGFLRIAFDTLETARERTFGARDAALKSGLQPAQIIDAPQRTSDTEGGFTAANPTIGRRANYRHWIIVGMNDETVLGGVRAAEGLGIAANDIIGVGIGGSGSATAEFGKGGMTGLWASILLSPRRHGYDTALAMYDWISKGVRPAPVTFTAGTLMTRDNFRALLARDAA